MMCAYAWSFDSKGPDVRGDLQHFGVGVLDHGVLVFAGSIDFLRMCSFGEGDSASGPWA